VEHIFQFKSDWIVKPKAIMLLLLSQTYEFR